MTGIVEQLSVAMTAASLGAARRLAHLTVRSGGMLVMTGAVSSLTVMVWCLDCYDAAGIRGGVSTLNNNLLRSYRRSLVAVRDHRNAGTIVGSYHCAVVCSWTALAHSTGQVRGNTRNYRNGVIIDRVGLCKGVGVAASVGAM